MRFQASYIHSVFEQAAERYDLMNDAMSLLGHRIWKKILINDIPPLPKALWVDVGAGTGDIAHLLYKKHYDLEPTIVACEPNPLMRQQGKQKTLNIGALSIQWSDHDAYNLPTPLVAASGVIFSFSLRNIPLWEKALKEAFARTQLGGTIHIMEFNALAHLQNSFYKNYQDHILPRLAQWIAHNPKPYEYLVESIRSFAPPQNIVKTLQDIGWTPIKEYTLAGGSVFVIKGKKT